MNKYQKSILLTAANIAIIGFSAVAATTATVAWFQYSETITAEGMSIECLSADRSVEWNILRYDEEVKSGVLSHDENDFHLPSYDQYITTKNIYSNVILAATVITPTGLSSVEQVYVDITCTGGLKGQDGKILALTSNVCQFKVTVYAYENPELGRLSCNTAVAQIESRNPTPEQADTAYKTATTFFNGTNSGAVSFVDVHNGTPAKDRDNKVTVIPRFNANGETVTAIYCYLECSYNPKLVEHYISQLDNGSIENQEISLEGDIDEIKFRFGEKYSGSYVQVENQADLTADDDYMIAFDDYTVAFDGSGTRPSHYNSENNSNYIPVEINRNRIAATEVTHNSDWSYTEAQNIRSRAGFNVGATQAAVAHNGLVASQTNNYPNDLTYQYDGIVSASNNNKYLSYDSNRNVTRFDYWDDMSTSGIENIKFYKYSDSEAANSILDFISIDTTSAPMSFVVGDVFSHSGMTVTAHYTDGSTSPVENYAVWTGYNMNLAGRQTVNVAYTEEGITANAIYYIDVTSGPTIKCVPSALKNQYVGGSARIRVDKFFFLDNQGNDSVVAFSWSINDSEVASIEPSAEGDTCMVYFSKAGPAKITVHAEDEWGNEDTTTIQVTVIGQQLDVTAYKKVKQNSELTAGEYLIVYEDEGNNVMLDGSRDQTIDAASNYNPVEITNDVIASTDSVLAGAFVFSYAPDSTTANKKFFIETKNGVRIGATSNANSLNTDATATNDNLYNTVSIDEQSENFEAIIVGSGGAYLRYNSASNQKRFRYYKSSTYTAQKAITLYKKSADNTNLKVREIREDPNNPLPKQFYTRSNFSITGGAIQARFNNGTLQNVTSQCSFTGYDMFHSGRQEVTVSYSLNGDTVKYKYFINVVDPALTGLSLQFNGDAKLNYETGETFSTEGIIALASYDNFSTQDVTDVATFTGFPDNPSFLGTATITVTYTEGAITFSQTFDITISPATTGFKLCRNAAELQIGDHIVIAAADENYAISKVQNTNNRGQTPIEKNGDNLPYTQATAVFEVCAGYEGNGYAFLDLSRGQYLTTASSSANYLRCSDTITAEASWSVSVSGGEATIVGLGKYTRKNMRYNKSSKLFACYASGQLAISIYRWHGEWTGFDVPLQNISTKSTIYNIHCNTTEYVTLAQELIFTPDDATNKNVTYQIDQSSDPGTINLTSGGTVTGLQPGFATVIIISEEDSTISCIVNFNVTNPYVPVESVNIDQTGPILLRLNETAQLSATVYPANATVQALNWQSEDNRMVTVDQNGLATVVSTGDSSQNINVDITVYSTESDEIYDTITITILVTDIVHVTGVTIDQNFNLAHVGDEYDLTCTLTPSDATYTNVTWSVAENSDQCITITSAGHLVCTGVGNARVQVRTEDGNFTAYLAFAVERGAVTEPEWNLATSTSQLAAGKQIIITSATKNVAMYEQTANNISETTITQNEGKTQITDIQNAMVLTLGRDTDWTFNPIGTSNYLCGTTQTKNYLRQKSTLDDTCNFTISIASDGVASITCTGTGVTRKYMRYNNSSKIFSCYQSGQQDISIYVNEGATYSPTSPNSSKPVNMLKTMAMDELMTFRTYFNTIIYKLKNEEKETNIPSYNNGFNLVENLKEFTTLKQSLLERRLSYAQRQ